MRQFYSRIFSALFEQARKDLAELCLFFLNQKSRTLKTQNSLEYFVKIEQYYAFGIKSFLLSTCNYHKLS